MLTVWWFSKLVHRSVYNCLKFILQQFPFSVAEKKYKFAFYNNF